MKKSLHKHNGFTLIELIAVVAILGIVTFLVTTNYRNRSEDARQGAAMAEMERIADALRKVEAYHGYYVPLTVLDDRASTPTGVTNADVIADHITFLIVDPETGQNPPLNSIRTIGDMLNGQPNTARFDEVHTERWKGPFLQYQKVVQTGFIGADLPLDPWGGPYHFLSISNGDEIDDRGNVGGTGYSVSTIGRYAIVSWGRDSTQNTADDLFYKFQ